MFFLASNMYCKFVIDTIYSSLKKINDMNMCSDILDDKLYESYLELEKLLNAEFL